MPTSSNEMATECVSCELTVRECVVISGSRSCLADFLVQHGVIRHKRECSTCGEQTALNVTDFSHTCRKVSYEDRSAQKLKKRRIQCQFRKSARVGTLFEKSQVGLEEIFYFVAMWCLQPSPRQSYIERELKWCSRTVVDWSSLCREVCVYWAIENSQKLGGPGTTVEINEAKFGKRKYSDQWMFAGYECDSKRIFLVPVTKRDAAGLLEIIRKWVLPGTRLVSSCWKVYKVLDHEGIQELRVDQSLEFLNYDDTQNTHNMWKGIRTGFPRHGGKDNHFIGYLAETLFKKHAGDAVIHHFLKTAAKLYPPPP